MQDIIAKRRASADLHQREDMLSLFLTHKSPEDKPYVCADTAVVLLLMVADRRDAA